MNRIALCIFFGLGLWGCAKSAEMAAPVEARKSYLQSSLTTQELFLHTEQYIQWVMGYSIRLRDEQRKLLATDWVMDDPYHRHQLTIRVNPGMDGNSILTANFTVQGLEDSGWVELASGGIPEEDFIFELEEQVRRIETERFQ